MSLEIRLWALGCWSYVKGPRPNLTRGANRLAMVAVRPSLPQCFELRSRHLNGPGVLRFRSETALCSDPRDRLCITCNRQTDPPRAAHFNWRSQGRVSGTRYLENSTNKAPSRYAETPSDAALPVRRL